MVWPDTLIIPTNGLMKVFESTVNNVVSAQDLDELMFQIINSFLNESSVAYAELDTLPDFSRLRDVKSAHLVKVCEATKALCVPLRLLLHQYGAYRDKTFSYFFLRFLGDDLILSHLPH